MKSKILSVLSLIFLLSGLVKAQTVYDNKIFKDNIRTVEFKGFDEKQNYPVVQLGTEQKLYLDFDDLDGELKNYQYTLIHCDYNWQPSNLMQNEYLDGVFYDYILDNETSFNTYITYTHYKLTVPNDIVKPKLSGNYVLKVYENGSEDDVVLTLKFFVFEPTSFIKVQLNRPTYTKFYETHQEVDVWINTGSNKPLNINEDFKMVIMQNGRWDNLKADIKPRFYNNGELDYNYEDVNVFKGSNEFRFFDTRNIRFGGQRIQNVFQDSFGVYNAVLYSDKNRSEESYVVYRDFNGQTLIEANGVGDENVEGDYNWVYFRVLANYEQEGDVYIFGAFSNWQLLDRYKLSYNKRKLWYEGKILLKQGYYNYFFAVENGKKIDAEALEGSFFQTENDYQIFFYMYSIQLNCDLLIGYKNVNSVFGNTND